MLSQLQKTVFKSRALGNNYTRIAKACGITPGNAYNIFTQTIKTLQKHIEEGKKSKELLDCLQFIYIDETDYVVWGYPMRLSLPHLIFTEAAEETATELFGAEYRIFSFKKLHTHGVRARVEDLIVHTLKFDHTAAKAISERNRGFVDGNYLKTRIEEEDMMKEAVMVSFDQDYGFDVKIPNILRYPAFNLKHNLPLGARL
ncbi:Uncharacterised protein [uncultured archaeon]|nr:Uncharacterised protein [uncultured archaeon]